MDALKKVPNDTTYSSSPGFGTPLHPVGPTQPQRLPQPAFKPPIPTILPIALPPPTLRPQAFRIFTKRYSLTLSTSALLALAAFVGRHCGAGWREEGTGERVLEETAKLWKAESGPVIVEDGKMLQGILRTLQSCMSGGRLGSTKQKSTMSRENSSTFSNDSAMDRESSRPRLEGRNSSFGMSTLEVEDGDDDEDSVKDPRGWLKVVSAFEQPRFSYDIDKKHFVPLTGKFSMLPSPSHKTALFRQRHALIHHRLLRNENFQTPSITSQHSTSNSKHSMTDQSFYKITPIANLLGRGGQSFMLLGMLVIAPSGTLALNDLSGSISLDLQHAVPFGDTSAFFTPGVIVLIDGTYEEDYAGTGSSGIGSTDGVGGTIGGKFLGFNISGPPVEKRNVSLGIDLKSGDMGAGLGWTDFLGTGSERAVGDRMRRLEQKLIGPESELSEEARRKMIILSELTLDDPTTLTALRKVLREYESAAQPPMAFLLMGNFCSHAAMAGAGMGSIDYKELFNELAAVLSDFPSLLRTSTWVFVPGDNDPWVSAFSAGAGTTVPRDGVPDIFTSRIKRAFATSRTEAGPGVLRDSMDGQAIWTSNPSRLTLFGPAHEVVVFRDDFSGRCRRNAIRTGQAIQRGQDVEPATEERSELQPDDDVAMSGALPDGMDSPVEDGMPGHAAADPAPPAPPEDPATILAKKLILTLLPQSTLSPFPPTIRPVHWSLAPSALSIYPLPHTVVLADSEAPAFAMTYEGCHVVNPGRFLERKGARRRRMGWVEYDLLSKRATIRENWIGYEVGR